ncbi:MAG: sodium:solute symporter [Bacteroidia bacterium]|nr:sodium:solute symporter [Bacteroidia bacterium]MDW8158008.1 sodium:solute symporter [Bacteroidia bacterium]
MGTLDWIVLLGTLLFIVVYGAWKTRGSKDIESYLRGNKDRWWTICLSIMATQASAITFLSTPGQAYEDGMRFIQNYFGLPLAMIVISATMLPVYYRLKVFTAYEFLESRFDLKIRLLAAALFLIQRGLAAGITIYAPAIVLSTILGWSLATTNFFIGSLVIFYTVSGGTRAVSQTQKQQMAVMMGGMIVAGVMVLYLMPKEVSLGQVFQVAGIMGKLNLVDFKFDLAERYTFWSGLLGGFFLAMSYFGTDHSQVARYIGGQSVAQSRVGLLFNGLLKVPMQFIILLIGVLVFVFFQFEKPPLIFNPVAYHKINTSPTLAPVLQNLEKAHANCFESKIQIWREINQEQQNFVLSSENSKIQKLRHLQNQADRIRDQALEMVKIVDPKTRDIDYVFLHFVLHYLPQGLVGLIIAVILSAAMSSTASELNALASTTTIDFYKRSIRQKASPSHYLWVSKVVTFFWGIAAILFATYASLFENLIEAVNILGSLFYGTVLGIFLIAFYLRFVRSFATFWAAIIAELVVLHLFFLRQIIDFLFDKSALPLYIETLANLGYLWYNVIGCVLTIVFAVILQWFYPYEGLKKRRKVL